MRALIDRIEDYVPTGVGRKGKHKGITTKIFEEVVHEGSRRIVEYGYGWPGDVEKTEEGGCLSGADLGAVSKEAYNRGSLQLGTLGGGNHFIELQVVQEVYDQEVGKHFGLFPGFLTVMIHTGAGFGHQICTDYSKSLLPAARKHGIEVPDRGLACACRLQEGWTTTQLWPARSTLLLPTGN